MTLDEAAHDLLRVIVPEWPAAGMRRLAWHPDRMMRRLRGSNGPSIWATHRLTPEDHVAKDWQVVLEMIA